MSASANTGAASLSRSVYCWVLPSSWSSGHPRPRARNRPGRVTARLGRPGHKVAVRVAPICCAGCYAKGCARCCASRRTVPAFVQVTTRFRRGRSAVIPVAAALLMSLGWREGRRDGRRGRCRGSGRAQPVARRPAPPRLAVVSPAAEPDAGAESGSWAVLPVVIVPGFSKPLFFREPAHVLIDAS